MRIKLVLGQLDDAVGIEDEGAAQWAGGPLAVDHLWALGVPAAGDGVARVGQQVVVDLVRVAKLGQALRGVGRHTEQYEAGVSQGGLVVTEVAHLGRAARAERLLEEVDNHSPAAEVGYSDLLAVGVGQRELGRRVAGSVMAVFSNKSPTRDAG
jgi:hypothetical protein